MRIGYFRLRFGMPLYLRHSTFENCYTLCSILKCSSNRLFTQDDQCESHHVLDISSDQGLTDEKYASALTQLRGMTDMACLLINQSIPGERGCG